MVCAGLSKHVLSNGRIVGYFKPFIAADENQPPPDDSDVIFMKRLLALAEPAELLGPVFNDESSLSKGIKEAYAKVSQGKDIVIIEGTTDQSQVSRSIVEALDARVIIVERYSKELPGAMKSDQDWGKHLLGVVINKVPGSRLERVRAEAFDKSGLSILGILPEDRTLLALTVSELAEHIQGEIVSGTENSAELVENLMLGAKCVDPGPEYFGRKVNKAVVIESERPDMQIAALETPTRCLVLSGNTAPKPIVLSRAKEKSVPVVSTRDGINIVVSNIEDALVQTKFNQDNKLPRLIEIMEQHFDFAGVDKGLGLAIS